MTVATQNCRRDIRYVAKEMDGNRKGSDGEETGAAPVHALTSSSLN